MMWADLLSMVPPFIENIALSLSLLCQGIQHLSTQAVLHPSKCLCLAKSYSVLIWHVLTLTSSLSPSSSSSSSLQQKLTTILTALLDTLREGERFIKGCQYYQGGMQWLIRPAVSKQHQWLINKGLPIALSTEIFDVHLHDFVWCISTMIWVLTHSVQDIRVQAERIDSLLKETWSLANEEDDVKSMQELFNKIGAKGHKEICNLICHRLSESTSRAKLNLTDAVVPTYLWMDPQNFQNMNDCVLGSNESVVVFETRLMGGRFACKHFHRPGYEEMFANEAAIQARLRHANVLQLVCCTMKAAGDNIRSLVMELMQQDLGSLISKRRLAGKDAPFSLLAGVDLMLQIAKGMEYLHDLGIMHRDLKSFNILVSDSQRASHSDERGHVNAKIADFGTSKAKPDTSMYTTKRIGTSIWRAPEVVDDDDDAKYSKKADVYSFAIVCSEILTGLPPAELLPCNLRSELPKLLKEGRRPKLPSDCPPAIASYIEKCWHGDASERPTFRQICRVFRFFKACILLRETEMLAWPLQDDMFDFEELERTAVERRQAEGTFYHSVLDIPSEMHVFETLRSKIETRKLQVSLQKLSLGGEPDVQRAATRELRMLAKRTEKNCLCIAEAGAVPHLVELLSCQDPHTQAHAVATLLALSIDEGIKGTIIACGAVHPIVEVLKTGNMDARENAAATLLSLSVVDENKVTIGASGAIPALIKLLCIDHGTLRVKKDAACALFSLCVYKRNQARAVRAHVIPLLMQLLRDQLSDIVDEALAILAILASSQEGRVAISQAQASALPIMVEHIQLGSPQNKEHAAAILLAVCSKDPLQLAVVRDLGAEGPLSDLVRTGTMRARRKASSLLDSMSKLEKNTSDLV